MLSNLVSLGTSNFMLCVTQWLWKDMASLIFFPLTSKWFVAAFIMLWSVISSYLWPGNQIIKHSSHMGFVFIRLEWGVTLLK